MTCFSSSGILASSLLAAALCCIPVSAQTPNRTVLDLQDKKSRADMEADQMVSLSADKIIEILRNEPGLLLQVKKMLVKKAFEQGRILESSDLTDDSLFRLLRDDDNIRVLATREIEDRFYIRAKPTLEEMQRERMRLQQHGLVRAGNPTPSVTNPTAEIKMNQEDKFWSIHDRDLEMYQPIKPEATPKPATPPADSVPENPARDVQRTSLQDQDFYDGIDVAGMSRISPDQLSTLLNTSAPGGGLASLQGGAGARGGLGGFGDSSMLGGAGLGGSSSGQMDLDLLQGLAGGAQLPSSSQNEAQSVADLTLPSSLERQRRQRPLSEMGLDKTRIGHRPNPYANVPSLYDLYSQVSPRPPVLERFGMDIFRNNSGNLESLPMDLPVGPDYVLGPGDGVTVDLWGGVSQRLRRTVDREGRLALPEVGTIPVSGRNLGDVQRLVQSALRSQFRDVEADVSLARIRTVRVYVVGDVAYPGAYDISSLSTAINALYAAGGPTTRGSLRHLRQYRGKQLVQEIDAYDLLLHGVHGEMARIESGDSILVPPIGPQITLTGMVRRPAIYELADEKSLSQVLELAGGVLPSGTLRHVDLERVVAHDKRTMLQLDIPETDNAEAVNKALDDFQVQDGDSVRISPILPYADKTVYLDGHVFHPGKYPYRDGMKITDLIHSYGDLMPEPSQRHAEVIRLQPPDYTPMVIAFNLGSAMDGKADDVTLKPFDTIRVFGRYDFEDPPLVTVSGEVRDPGDHITNGVTRLRDAVYLAGGVTQEAELDDVQVFRKGDDGKLKVLSVNLAGALAGDTNSNLLLLPKDRVFIHRSQLKADPATVQVQGEVARPGRYPLGEGMTASDLVKLAGGFKRGAETETADLARYLSPDGKAAGERQTVEIAKAMSGASDADPTLHDGDVLTIGQQPGFTDLGSVITIRGEVLHPGTYGIREGERLSAVLQRAGGLRSSAYPYGAILERTQVRELEEKTRADLIRHLQAEGNSLKLIPDTDADQRMAKEASLAQWQAALDKLQNAPPNGRMVVHVSKDAKKWANTPADIEVRAGDVLTIPKTPNFVMVNGSVYNPTAVTYKPGRNAGWYLEQAGGPTNVANKKAMFLIRADGSVVGGRGGLFTGGALDAEVRPGDMLVVPEKAYSGTTRWKSTLEAAQLAYAVGVAIQVARSF